MKRNFTKYPFIRGTTCEKSLWLEYNNPELKAPPTAEQLAIMEKGTEVGIIARQLFAGGVDLSKNETVYGKRLLAATREALKGDEPILYEASFEADAYNLHLNFKADIFIRTPRRTKLIEVKSTTKLKEPDHILDLGLQYFILKHSDYSGPEIEVYIAYLNREYVRGEELDIDKLFVVENLTARIKSAQYLIEQYLQQFSVLLERETVPNVKVSAACLKPQKCPFYNHCWKKIPNSTVFNISRLRNSKASELAARGIIEMKDFPDDEQLTPGQWIEVNASRQAKPHINKAGIRGILDSLELDGPTLWMDFETLMPAIPEFPGTRPYQQLCTQYSVIYRKHRSGRLQRREFLAERNRDPRESFIRHLLSDTEEDGTIICYNQTFEKTRLKELADDFPQYRRAIHERISRMQDLILVFSEKHYYHPLQNGSYSLKSVLPVLVDPVKLSYENLKIKNGAQAMQMYERYSRLPRLEQLETKHALLEYCHVDVKSMVLIVEALENLL